jgi:hypothetical protein
LIFDQQVDGIARDIRHRLRQALGEERRGVGLFADEIGEQITRKSTRKAHPRFLRVRPDETYPLETTKFQGVNFRDSVAVPTIVMAAGCF